MTLAAAAGRRTPEGENQRLQQLIERVRSAFTLAGATEQPQSLPEEVEEGNVEYKLQLLDPAPGTNDDNNIQARGWRLYNVDFAIRSPHVFPLLPSWSAPTAKSTL